MDLQPNGATENHSTNYPALNNTHFMYVSTTPMLLYCITSLCIGFVAFLGNTLVVYIVIKVHQMQTYTNWLILNLAISDLAISLVCIPFEIPLELNNGEWPYHPTLCHIFYPLQSLIVYSSVFTLVALSISRYWAVLHPFRVQPNIKCAKIIILLIWFCSFVVVTPYALVLKYNNDTKTCEETWSMTGNLVYTISILFFQYVGPLSIILFAYCCIIYDIYYVNKKNFLVDKVKLMETKKVIKLLLVITVIFAVCVFPFHIVALLQVFSPNVHFSRYLSDSSLLVLYLNSALNPVMYNIFNEKFRKAFKELYHNICSCINNKRSGVLYLNHDSIPITNPSHKILYTASKICHKKEVVRLSSYSQNFENHKRKQQNKHNEFDKMMNSHFV